MNVFDIHIPPLRERRDDILPLAAGFLREFAGGAGGIDARGDGGIARHEWPGNVRELRNVLERALIMCDGPFIDAEHLCLRARKDASPSTSSDLGALRGMRSNELCARPMATSTSGQAARNNADASYIPGSGSLDSKR